MPPARNKGIDPFFHLYWEVILAFPTSRTSLIRSMLDDLDPCCLPLWGDAAGWMLAVMAPGAQT